MKNYSCISQIWDDLDQGHTVNWIHEGYKLTIEEAHCEYQKNHFTHRNGKVLRITCISNWFGSLMELSELPKLFRGVK